jgi:hypothetical protein
MSGAALSIRPVPVNTDVELVFSEIQVEPSEVRDIVQTGDTVYIVFDDSAIRDRVEFLNQSELFGAEAIVQKETLEAFNRAKYPEPAKPASVLPPQPLPQISTFTSSGDDLLDKLQIKQLSVRAALPSDDAYHVLKANIGLVTLAILTMLAFFSLLA